MIRKKTTEEKMILAINDKTNYISLIVRKTKSAISHALNISHDLEDEGILSRETRKGRIIIVKLTPKGQRIKDAYIELNAAYNDGKPKI